MHASNNAVALCVSGWTPSLAIAASSPTASLAFPWRPSSLMRRVTSVLTRISSAVGGAVAGFNYLIKRNLVS